MIFVTVGTHEQQFNRLIEAVDKLKGKGVIEDEVIMQTGYCTYEPTYCKWNKLISYRDMKKNIEEARIVVTHGGPASFIAPLQVGKIPIVVPRQKQYDEHVNDHQLEFSRCVQKRYNNILVVEKIEDIEYLIMNYDSVIVKLSDSSIGNQKEFNAKFSEIVDDLGIR